MKHAVIIGGSMAGLLAARVLSDHFQTVTILERDEFPDGVRDRRGVPQGRHAHGLLAKGAERIIAMFPGIREELVADGAISIDMGTSMRWYHFGGFKTEKQTGLIGTLQSRALLETHIRRRVLALPNVIAIQGRDAQGLMFDDGGTRVTGVIAGEPIAGDLVIDSRLRRPSRIEGADRRGLQHAHLPAQPRRFAAPVKR